MGRFIVAATKGWPRGPQPEPRYERARRLPAFVSRRRRARTAQSQPKASRRSRRKGRGRGGEEKVPALGRFPRPRFVVPSPVLMTPGRDIDVHVDRPGSGRARWVKGKSGKREIGGPSALISRPARTTELALCARREAPFETRPSPACGIPSGDVSSTGSRGPAIGRDCFGSLLKRGFVVIMYS